MPAELVCAAEAAESELFAWPQGGERHRRTGRSRGGAEPSRPRAAWPGRRRGAAALGGPHAGSDGAGPAAR